VSQFPPIDDGHTAVYVLQLDLVDAGGVAGCCAAPPGLGGEGRDECRARALGAAVEAVQGQLLPGAGSSAGRLREAAWLPLEPHLSEGAGDKEGMIQQAASSVSDCHAMYWP
jgi:hypothetical protein